MKVILLSFDNGEQWGDHRRWPIGIFRKTSRAKIDEATNATLEKYHYYRLPEVYETEVELDTYNTEGVDLR